MFLEKHLGVKIRKFEAVERQIDGLLFLQQGI